MIDKVESRGKDNSHHTDIAWFSEVVDRAGAVYLMWCDFRKPYNEVAFSDLKNILGDWVVVTNAPKEKVAESRFVPEVVKYHGYPRKSGHVDFTNKSSQK